MVQAKKNVSRAFTDIGRGPHDWIRYIPSRKFCTRFATTVTPHTGPHRSMMKRYVILCCACSAVNDSSSFSAAPGAASLSGFHIAAHHQHQQLGRRTPAAAAACRHPPSTAVMLGARQGGQGWRGKVASAAVAVSVLVGASAAAPLDAGAARAPKQEPVVQALVQLPDEKVDWTM